QIDESKNTANIVLDAVMKWDFTDNWSIWFGQTKLPGNRERVISSQKLQFVDRSLVNSRFNLDRDLGVQLHHTSKTGGMVWNQAIAVSMGEGRNITEPNPGGGYEFTGRIEFLPFGDFSGGGDYFGSDLKRENTPKLSIGVSGDMNYNSTRVNGNLGKFLIDSVGDYVTNDLGSVFADMMFKYKGFSAMSEYAYRTTLNANNGFGTGTGFVFQAGYLLPSNWELAARYTDIQKATGSALKEQTEYTLGLSRYVVGHNLKVQTDISYDDFAASDNQWMFRFQTELAF
ncbi:MAG: OprO/OprP family phosphate-selective porin, partial [Cyclobacteriaceae bacterium]|nr:OprO/OprP family phosphate-selective porin [Cyclobacteriaceae bacterium]